MKLKKKINILTDLNNLFKLVESSSNTEFIISYSKNKIYTSEEFIYYCTNVLKLDLKSKLIVKEKNIPILKHVIVSLDYYIDYLTYYVTNKESYFVSEASIYRILKAHDLITSPAVIVIKAANECKDKTNGINQLWQTDITYLKIVG